MAKRHQELMLEPSDIQEGFTRRETPLHTATAPKAPSVIEKLYLTHADGLAASLRKMYGAGPPDPDDVAQQAFQQLIERGDLGSITNLKAFLWRTARNLVLASRRARAVRSRYDYEVEHLLFPLKDDVATPESALVVKEQLKTISDVLRSMPERRRRVVVLHRVEGLTLAEVARRLGISRPSAAAHLARGLADINMAFLDDGAPTIP